MDNEWKSVNPDSLDIWDRNYNSYAFEVIDSNKIPVLQVIMGHENELLIGGSFYNQGIPIFATLTNGFSFISDWNISSRMWQEFRDSTIFKYPSVSHLGEIKSLPSHDWSNPNSTDQTFTSNDPLSVSNWKICGGYVAMTLGIIITTFVSVETIKNRKSG
jgi:hypothetical protein